MTMLLALLALSIGVGEWTQDEPPAPAEQPPYTSARLTHERMEQLVAGPLRLIERGEIEAAERAFARLIARVAREHGPASLDVADHIVAFGMMLFERSGNPAVRSRGIDYLRRGADAYAATFGRNHPEVALTLSDVGNAWLVLRPDDPPAEAEAALEESWRIRAATLGWTNVETASALVTLARVRGLPSRTQRDLGRIEASAALFGEAINDFGRNFVKPGLFGSITTRFHLARMYLLNGLPVEAAAAALKAQADYRRNFAGDRGMCRLLVSQTLSFERRLQRTGHLAQAAALERSLRQGDLPCYDGAPGRLFFPLPEDEVPPEPEG